MSRSKKLITTVRRLAVCALLFICGFQLFESYQEWQDNPLSMYTLEEPKHRIPFPSVTVCPEGFGLWSGVREFLNQIEFKDEYKERLQKTYREFVRLKYWIAHMTDHETNIEDCFGNPQVKITRSK